MFHNPGVNSIVAAVHHVMNFKKVHETYETKITHHR